MSDSTRYVGLDVHAKTIAIAIAEEGRGEPLFLSTIPNDLARLLRALDLLGSRESLHCAYEAGPTGYAGSRRSGSRTEINGRRTCPSTSSSSTPLLHGLS